MNPAAKIHAVGIQPDFTSFDCVDWNDLDSIGAYAGTMQALFLWDADMCARALRVALETQTLCDAVLALGGEVAV